MDLYKILPKASIPQNFGGYGLNHIEKKKNWALFSGQTNLITETKLYLILKKN